MASRGRPKGSGRDWKPTLQIIADMLVANPTQTANGAILTIAVTENPHNVENFRRVVHREWAKKKEIYLEEARDRAFHNSEAKTCIYLPSRTLTINRPNLFEVASAAVRLSKKLEVAMGPAYNISLNIPTFDFLNTPEMTAIRGLTESPGMKAAMEFGRRYERMMKSFSVSSKALPV